MDETRLLVEKYLDGRITAEQLADLDRLLQVDPQAAELFARLTRFEGLLQSSFQREADIQETSDRLRRAIASGRRKPVRRAARWLAGAAALVAALGVLWLALRPAGDPVAKDGADHRPLTKITGGDIKVNGQLASSAGVGDRLQIVSESPATLSLPGGSEAAFESASELVLHGEVGDMRQVVELVEGTGVFKVEAADCPFQVETPVGRITALGTEFRVMLRRQADPKERVFRGTTITSLAVMVVSGVVEVEVGGKTVTLHAGDDRNFPPSGEGGKAVRETRTLFDRIDSEQMIFVQSGDSPKRISVPRDSDLRVIIDGKPGRVQELGKGMIVFLQRFHGDNQVIGLRAEGPTLAGTLESVAADGRSLTIQLRKGKETAGQSRPIAVRPETKVDIGGKSAGLAELPAGTPVTVKLTANQEAASQVTVPRNREKERRK